MLVVSAHPPLKNSKEAGQKVFFNFLKFMSDFVDIHLITIVNRQEHSWGLKESLSELQCPEFKVIEISGIRKLVNCLLYPLRAIHYNTKASSDAAKEMQILLERNTYKYIHFEWEQMMQYTEQLDNKIRKNSRISVTCHDVMNQMYERKSRRGKLRLFYTLQTKLCVRNEINWFSQVDTILTLNDKDRKLVDELKLNRNTQVVRPFYHTAPELNRENKRYDLVFFGALNRDENHDAIVWFINEIFPYITELNPAINLVIVGNGPSKELYQLAQSCPNIEVTGFVEDPFQVIAKARIGIIPLRLGAGIKIKLLESMACGIPIVSTSVGAEGTDFTQEDGVFIVDDPQLFAESVIHLSSNEALALQLGERARLSIEETYSREEYVQSITQAFNLTIPMEKNIIEKDSLVPAL